MVQRKSTYLISVNKSTYQSSKESFCNSVYSKVILRALLGQDIFWGSMLLPFNLPTEYVNLLISCQTLDLLTIIVMAPVNKQIMLPTEKLAHELNQLITTFRIINDFQKGSKFLK